MPRTATPPSAAWLPRSLSLTLTHTLRTHIARFAGAQRAHACSLAGRSGPQPRRVQRLAHLLLQGAFAARARAHRACGASPAGQRLRVGAGGAGPRCRRSGEGVCAYAAGDRSRTRRADTGGEDQENTARKGAITRGRGGARVGARGRARSKSSSQAGSAQGRGGGGAVGSGAACCVAAWDQTLDDDEEEEEDDDDDDDDDDVML